MKLYNFYMSLIEISLPIILHLCFIYDLNPSFFEKNYLHIFSRFYNFVYMTSNPNILFNYAEHL